MDIMVVQFFYRKLEIESQVDEENNFGFGCEKFNQVNLKIV